MTRNLNQIQQILEHFRIPMPQVEFTETNEIDPTTLKYCRYCGILTCPQQSFEIIQKNCAHKPRKIRLNSRTLPSQLFSNRNMLAQEFKPEAVEISYSEEIPIEEEIFVDGESSDLVKLVAASAKLLDLPHFVPSERTSVTIAAAKCFFEAFNIEKHRTNSVPGNRAAFSIKKSPLRLVTSSHLPSRN